MSWRRYFVPELKILKKVKSGERYRYIFKLSLNLGVGKYSITTALTSSDTHLVHNYEWRDLALDFEVINIDKDKFLGCVWLDPDIEIKRIG